MSAWAERLVRIIATICILGGSAFGAVAQTDLRIMAPAAPGGGWDQTARAMQQALVATRLVKSVQVYNVAGWAAASGLRNSSRRRRATRTSSW